MLRLSHSVAWTTLRHVWNSGIEVSSTKHRNELLSSSLMLSCSRLMPASFHTLADHTPHSKRDSQTAAFRCIRPMPQQPRGLSEGCRRFFCPGGLAVHCSFLILQDTKTSD